MAHDCEMVYESLGTQHTTVQDDVHSNCKHKEGTRLGFLFGRGCILHYSQYIGSQTSYSRKW